MRHLTSIGVSDEATTSSDILQCLRLLPPPDPEDLPLKTEPQWWLPPTGACCFTQPPKRKWEEERPVPPSLYKDGRGLAASMHMIPPDASVPGEASNALPLFNAAQPTVTVDAPTVTTNSQGPETLSIHPSLLRAPLNIQTQPVGTNSANPVVSAPLEAEASDSCCLTTADYADGGWTYVGTPRRTQVDKKRDRRARKLAHETARASQIPPTGLSGTNWDYSKARPTRSC